MDERLTSCITFPTAEIAASVALVTFFPGSPISSAFDSLIEYVGDRVQIVLLCWIILGALLWLFRPNVLRRRHTLSSKIWFLAYSCLAGLIFDNIATLFQLGFAFASLANPLILRSIAIRNVTYALCFATAIAWTYLVETGKLLDLSWPQRFGRR